MKRIIIVISVFVILVACTNLSGETVKVIGVNGNIKILSFDKNTTEMLLSKTIPKIRTIEGLSKFKNLKKLTISFADLTSTDFSFFDELKNLKVLQFNFTEMNDISFIGRIPSLVTFSCYETVDINNLNVINLEQNDNLEYLGLLLDTLSDVPKIINIPESMKYIDFNYILFKKMSLENLYLLSKHENVSYVFSDDIDECMRKLNLDINLFDNSKYVNLLKQYGIQ